MSLFLNGVLIRYPIFWEIRHFENSKRMELRKQKERFRQGKEKERRTGFWNIFTLKNLDTIEDHHNKQNIEDQPC